MMKALILAPFAHQHLRRLARRLELRYEPWTQTRRLYDPEELAHRLRSEGIAILIVEADFVLAPTLEEAAPPLRLVGVCRNALDHIDLPAATERGVLVVHSPGRNAVAVTELTLGLMLSLARRIPQAHNLVAGGGWQDPVGPYIEMQGREMAGSTVGIVGLGQIGFEVAKRLRALGARLLAYDPYAPPERLRRSGARAMPLPELMAAADFVTLHAPSTSKTQGLIDAEMLGLMKPTAYLVNTADASLVDVEALLAALQEGRIAGAALDVHEGHPLPPKSPFLALPNVILTPHIGGATVETVERHSRIMAQEVERFLAGRPLRCLANPEALVNLPLES
ncbi:MAG TPA: NAD(P)-dependent oxidoreductase [Dehalococcoidia bacterium]|nr:NAD(P)-dependent oxidoreductase [Dehalococcoidia bacterium]